MESFMPLGYCLSWNPALVSLFVVGNSLVTLSCYSISASIGTLARKKSNLVFHWMFVLFGAFILACGTTHLIKMWSIWHADYWLDASTDAFTGVLSLVTAILVLPLIPKILALPSPTQFQAEIAARKRAEAKFRGLLEAAPDAMVILDRDGKIVLVNEQTEKIFGDKREHMLGKSVDSLLPKAFNDETDRSWKDFIQEKMIDDRLVIESMCLRHDGTLVPVEIRMAAISTDEGTFISTSVRDITARRAAEQQLRDSEERFRLLVEAGRDYSIVMLDNEGKVVLWNTGAEKLEGYRPKEIIGESFAKFYSEEDQASEKPAHDLRIAAVAGRFEDENWRVRRDGTKFFASVLLISIKDENGKLRGFANITRDITERKKSEESEKELTERLSRSNKELQQFAYVVAHDLREPLRSISTFGGLLSSTCTNKLDEKETEFLQIVLSATERMQHLITDLLAYCRVERTATEATVVDTEELIEQVMTNLHVAVEESHGRIELGNLPKIIADPVMMRQLFQNLIGNAIKYRGAEPPVVQVTGAKKNGSWNFEVADNGIGFDMNFAERIFQPFHRLHAGNKYPGTGIGLAICRKIVEHHGGKIWAESKPSDSPGSKFYFTIPTHAAAREAV